MKHEILLINLCMLNAHMRHKDKIKFRIGHQ